MSTIVGPFSVTPGTVTRVQVDGSAAVLLVQNVTAYDLYVALGPVGPIDGNPTSQQTQAYPKSVPAWTPLPITVPPGWPPFDGWVTLFATTPAGLSLFGTTAGRNEVIITVYRPGEPVPPPGSIQRPDALNQSRSIVIPPFPFLADNAINWTNPGAAALMRPNIWTAASLPPGVVFPWFLVFYVDYLDLFLSNAATTGILDFYVYLIVENAANAVLSTAIWSEIRLSNVSGGAAGQYSLPRPRYIGQTIGATADHAFFQFQVVSAPTTNSSVVGNMGVDVDWWNQAPPRYVGGGVVGRTSVLQQTGGGNPPVPVVW